MAQLSTTSQQQPNQKMKIVGIIVAVLIAHAIFLWALSTLKTHPVFVPKPKPVQVRLVKIVEPKKIEQPKPKPKPPAPTKPKEVKIVEKPTPQPPKHIPKVQEVKKVAPKPVQEHVETPPAPVQSVTTTVTKVEKPVVVTPPPAPPAPPIPPAPPVSNTPVNLGDGAGASWKIKPRPRISSDDLASATNTTITVRFDVDVKGRITSAEIRKGSGNAKIDNEILRAVKAAKFNPYKENGVAVPFFAVQPFSLN